jgi:phage terminase small subunit
MCDKRDSQKKRFIDALTAQGTVFHAAQAAGVSRWTAYRWRHDPEFASLWDVAIENAVDAVESVIYQQAVGGNTLAAIFYLKAHRPQYRDRLNIDIKQLHSEIEEAIARIQANHDLLAQSEFPAERLALKE